MTQYRRYARAVALPGLLLAVAACASSGGFATGAPAPVIAQQQVEATAPAQPVHVVFAWSLRERDARFSGDGVARVQPQYLGRLDLFGPRGETYLEAAISGGQLRLPPGSPTDALPPAALLWAALGVLYPPDGATLVATSTEAGETRLEYARGDERWRFRLQNDMLRYAEWQDGASGRRTVEVEAGQGASFPARTLYRDWLAFRELELTLETIEYVDAFSEDIFRIPR